MKNLILFAVIITIMSGFRVYDPNCSTGIEDLSPGIHILDKEKPINSLDELKEDLADQEIFIPRIPQYMVIDKLGNVIENNALRPSDQQELYNQLSELLKYTDS